MARDYFSDKATLTEQAAALLRLYDAPHYFRRAGKGRFRKASAEIFYRATSYRRCYSNVLIRLSHYNRAMRWLVIFCLVAIVVSMASALVFLYRGQEGGSKRMLRALQIRVGLSVGLFVFLMISYKFGFIGSQGVGG